MAPGAQTVGDFVQDRVAHGFSGALTLDERRRRMREGVDHVRNSISPRPRRGNLHRTNSSSSRTTISIDEARQMHYGHQQDRWDTDTGDLDDSSTVASGTIYSAHQFKLHETGQLHEFADSPAPEGYSNSEPSIAEEEEDDDRASTSAVSVRTAPAHHPGIHSTFVGRGSNNWAEANSNRPRTASNVSRSLAQINGHQPQQHYFNRGSMVSINSLPHASLPQHPKPSSHSTTLRMREASAPPSISPRSRAFSPPNRREIGGAGVYTNGFHAPTSHPMSNSDLQTPPIEEDEETGIDAKIGQARSVQLIHHKHSMSNISQISTLSRTSSVTDMRRSKSTNRFRTKRSHVGLRRARRNNAEAELDHSPMELSRMTYQQLADEDFDQPLKKALPSHVLEFPDGIEDDDMEGKCDHIRKAQDHRSQAAIDAGARSTQETFFANLSINDYEECGDVIVGQLAELVGRLKKVRQAKRKAARDFESEIAKRETMVRTRTDNLHKELMRLRKSGQEALTAAMASSTIA